MLFFKESTSSAIYCKITISFGELLIFTSTFLGGFFFANFQTRISYFFTMGLSPCTAWVGDRYIGEVISPFRTLPWQKMTAQFQFFQSLPHKKANFVKKSRPNMGYISFFLVHWNIFKHFALLLSFVSTDFNYTHVLNQPFFFICSYL